jgi:hypothetical protein
LRIAVNANPINTRGHAAGRFRLASPTTASILGALVLLLLAVAVPLGRLVHHGWVSNAAGGPAVFAFAVVGVVVARQQPRHPMGWILLGIGAGFALNTDASNYLILDYRLHHGDLPFGWVAALLQPAWAPAVMLSGFAVLLFPDGCLPANRLRWVAWTYVAIGSLWMFGAYAIVAAAVVGHNVHIVPSGDLSVINNPTGAAVWWGWVQDVYFPELAATWVLWWIWQVRTFRRATGERRLQLKWLLSGAAIFALSLPLLFTSSNPSSTLEAILNIVAVISLAALPISIGVGILKFRLYEIDRLVSRTISYAVLTAVLVGVFAGIVTLTTRVLPFSSPVAVAASTLAAAALFNPLRRRVQHLVDRRFNRARYDAEAIVAAFSARLQDAVDLETVSGDLLSAVRSLQPAHASVWIRPRNSSSQA